MAELADPALLAALMLLAAIVGGYTGAIARVPRVVGYLLGGVFLHYMLLNFLGPRIPGAAPSGPLAVAVEHLHSIRTIALGLIMFSIGSVFEAKHIHSIGPRVLRLTLLKMLCVLALVTLGCSAIALLRQDLPPGSAVALGLLLGVVGIATAPAATLLVLREYEAKGPNSDAILTMTAFNNIVCIVLFHAVFMVLSWTGQIQSSFSSGHWLWLDLLSISLGSIVLGVAVGFLLSILYVKITIADFMLIFLGVLVVLGIFRDTLADSFHLSYSFLLTALFIGATFANITPDQQPFHNALRTFSGPIFALFFVLAGFELHLESLLNLGWLGGAYVLLRIAGKTLGGWAGVRWMHVAEYSPAIGLGMLCQAGVAIGLAAFVQATWGTMVHGAFLPHPAGEAFQTIILGSVVVFELVGPIALKQIAVAGGEVKAVTLLRRRRTPGHENESVLQQAWESLLQNFRPRRRPVPAQKAPLQVRHIMRSNVKVLPASARLDEVLHFVEGSRHNHFPVVDDDGGYVGMIHFADLRNIMYAREIRNLVTATDLARADTPTVTRDTPLETLYEKFHFHESDVGSLAVLESGPTHRVVGMVEQRDLLLALRASHEEQPPAKQPG